MKKRKQASLAAGQEPTFAQLALKHLKTQQRDEETGKVFLPVGDKLSDLMASKQDGFREPADLGALIVAGKTVLFWSDQHWGHARIIQYTKPARDEFSNVDEMDQAMADRARERALAAAKKDGEAPWMVFGGDIAMHGSNRVNALLRSIPAKKWLTVGNHDFTKDGEYLRWAVDAVCLGFEFSLTREQAKAFFSKGARAQEWADEQFDWDSLPERVRFGVCHYPISLDLLPTDMVNLHGHTHQNQSPPLRVNFSVEHLGCQPRTLDELIAPRDLRLLAERAHDPKEVVRAEREFLDRLAAQRAEREEGKRTMSHSQAIRASL
jgi:calcineurin-like phosphoesterase family protein